MKKLDKKFDGVIFKVKDGTIVPPDQYIVFLAKDHALPAALDAYAVECTRLSCDTAQIKAVHELIRNVHQWRNENPDKCKVPDAAGEALLS